MTLRTPIPNDTVALLLELYSKPASFKDMSIATGLSVPVIRRCLQETEGLSRKRILTPRPLNDDEVVNLYLSGLSITEVATALSSVPHAVQRRLHKNGIKGHPFSKRKKYSLNDAAFDILTEESAYWTGFLMADGYVYRGQSKNRVVLTLSSRDHAHLEKWRTWLKSTHPIKVFTQDGHAKSSLIIHSEQIADRLATFGVVQAKSLNAQVSPDLANNRDFWRGVIDGDGHLTMGRDKPTLFLCGSKYLVMQFRQFLHRHNVNFRSRLYQEQNIYRSNHSCNNALDIARLLYQDATVALDRKLLIANQMIACPPSQRRHFALSAP